MGSDIVIFGTGRYFDNYMMCHGEEAGKRPIFAVDNDVSKAGTVRNGVEIRRPEALRQLAPGSFYVVICCGQHQATVTWADLNDIGPLRARVLNLKGILSDKIHKCKIVQSSEDVYITAGIPYPKYWDK